MPHNLGPLMTRKRHMAPLGGLEGNGYTITAREITV